MTRAALAIAFVAACGGSGKPAKPAPVAHDRGEPTRSTYAELEERIPKIIAAMDRLAKDLGAVKDDCPKIAAVLRKWGSEFAVELDGLWELKNKLTPDEKDRYALEHDDDAKRLEPVFAAAMASCQGNDEVEDALTVAGFRRVETAR